MRTSPMPRRGAQRRAVSGRLHVAGGRRCSRRLLSLMQHGRGGMSHARPSVGGSGSGSGCQSFGGPFPCPPEGAAQVGGLRRNHRLDEAVGRGGVAFVAAPLGRHREGPCGQLQDATGPAGPLLDAVVGDQQATAQFGQVRLNFFPVTPRVVRSVRVVIGPLSSRRLASRRASSDRPGAQTASSSSPANS